MLTLTLKQLHKQHAIEMYYADGIHTVTAQYSLVEVHDVTSPRLHRGHSMIEQVINRLQYIYPKSYKRLSTSIVIYDLKTLVGKI